MGLSNLSVKQAKKLGEIIAKEFNRPPYFEISGELLIRGGANDVYDCLKWAFGKNFDIDYTKPSPSVYPLWNKIHGDLFRLSDSEKIEDAYKHIGEAYVNALKIIRRKRSKQCLKAITEKSQRNS